MMIKITFEYGQQGRMGDTLGPYDFVQVTYDTVRAGPDGDFVLAHFANGLWVTVDGQQWSDFVVHT